MIEAAVSKIIRLSEACLTCQGGFGMSDDLRKAVRSYATRRITIPIVTTSSDHLVPAAMVLLVQLKGESQSLDRMSYTGRMLLSFPSLSSLCLMPHKNLNIQVHEVQAAP